MIRVSKPRAPQNLNKGIEVTRQNCEAYSAHSASYHTGRRKFKFDRNIYGHKSVRDTLRASQRGKCCFCEGKFAAYAAGDVEHYRPKGAIRQDEESVVLNPGYYWLAYSWENLYWSCQVCNRTNKRDLFPLRDPSRRARSHEEEIGQEDPLILDPGGAADPKEHIEFRHELAVGVTDIGRTTVQVIGLNRVDLIEERLARLAKLKRLLEIVGLGECPELPEFKELVVSARSELEKAVAPESAFSAMAADYLSPA